MKNVSVSKKAPKFAFQRNCHVLAVLLFSRHRQPTMSEIFLGTALVTALINRATKDFGVRTLTNCIIGDATGSEIFIDGTLDNFDEQYKLHGHVVFSQSMTMVIEVLDALSFCGFVNPKYTCVGLDSADHIDTNVSLWWVSNLIKIRILVHIAAFLYGKKVRGEGDPEELDIFKMPTSIVRVASFIAEFEKSDDFLCAAKDAHKEHCRRVPGIMRMYNAIGVTREEATKEECIFSGCITGNSSLPIDEILSMIRVTRRTDVEKDNVPEEDSTGHFLIQDEQREFVSLTPEEIAEQPPSSSEDSDDEKPPTCEGFP